MQIFETHKCVSAYQIRCYLLLLARALKIRKTVASGMHSAFVLSWRLGALHEEAQHEHGQVRVMPVHAVRDDDREGLHEVLRGGT